MKTLSSEYMEELNHLDLQSLTPLRAAPAALPASGAQGAAPQKAGGMPAAPSQRGAASWEGTEEPGRVPPEDMSLITETG